MAAFDPQNPNPHYHAYLWRLNIGGDHQGRGYGQFAVDAQPRGAPARAKQADRLLPAWRKRSGRFYRRLGFLATGEFIEDEAVAERHLIA
jgi:diamine N-acetyltransferase